MHWGWTGTQLAMLGLLVFMQRQPQLYTDRERKFIVGFGLFALVAGVILP